ncbi:hypothetical protein BABINDRAFT_162231 [Babjeviella inositovora NRRL Y-12698]|uniref:Mitochondrial distribution and morphology protein 34 n=1 Tax=Babjeviella inositovora NRRL Y-12698 TaxID=984486 RepID=A0A1E3QND7_9ASCO|nr:uncharacterized protein BABINDRAFT_162231 [Babjeviella inositovora NRRL Y-12698]ODQ79191.1 hypothetical protein BABINDRAFT_162231 [Babjeviella inositovora NRRL Y-12698]
MSFNINWNSLDKASLTNWTKELLTDALNFGKRPNVLASDIAVKDLNFGDSAPVFEILEIGDLAQDRFRGIFKIHYTGNAHLTLHTQVQANPLSIYDSSIRDQGTGFAEPSFLLASESFALPLDLKLSSIKLSGIVIIVFSKEKGLTLVFRNDPLENITVSSTFDNVHVLANFLQTQIENQIRDVFRETLPSVLYRLSQKYTVDNNNLQDLHSHLISKQDEGERISLNDINPEAPNFLLAKNMKKLGTLTSSRQTFALYVPYMPDVYQRSNLEKFNKRMPTLSNALNVSNPRSFNGIPGDILTSDTSFESGLESSWRINKTVTEISKIQAKAYYKANSNVKPKRRVIKMGKAKLETEPEMMAPVRLSPVSLSPPPVLQPTPVKKYTERLNIPSQPSPLHFEYSHRSSKPHTVDIRPVAESPTHSSANLFANVGLGYANNYFLHSKKLELDDIEDPVTPLHASRSLRLVPSTAQIKSNLSRLNSAFQLDQASARLHSLKVTHHPKYDLRPAPVSEKIRLQNSTKPVLVHDMPPPYAF